MPEESRRGPIPREAVEFLERKGVQPGFSYLDVWAEEHHRAFTAAKVMREDVLEAMHQEVAKALREGKPYHEFSRDLGQRLQQMGWWGEQRVADPMTGEVADVDVPSRLHRIYDTNMRTARAAGQWERVQRAKDTHPYLLYQLGPSKEHRPEHVAWHGLLLHVDDPFWREHFPPNGWGCKCWVRQVSRREAARLEKGGITAPDPRPILDAAGLPTGHVDQSRKVPVRTERPATVYVDFKNKRTGVEERVPKGIDPGFHRPPTQLRTPGGSPPPAPASPQAPPRASASRAPALDPELEREILHTGARAKPSRPISTREAGELLGRALADRTGQRGAMVRRFARAMVRDHLGHEMREGTESYPNSDDLVFGALPRGVLGTHNLADGTMRMQAGLRRGLETASRQLASGRKLSKTSQEALHVLIHETIHGFGFDSLSDARDHVVASPAGRNIEELITETVARKVMRERFGAQEPKDVRERAYEHVIVRARQALEEVATQHSIDLLGPDAEGTASRINAAIEDASVTMRTAPSIVSGDAAAVADSSTPNAFVRAFVDAIPQVKNKRKASKMLYQRLSDPRYLQGR